MKKLFILLTVCTLILAGCGGQSKQPITESQSVETTTQVEETVSTEIEETEVVETVEVESTQESVQADAEESKVELEPTTEPEKPQQEAEQSKPEETTPSQEEKPEPESPVSTEAPTPAPTEPEQPKEQPTEAPAEVETVAYDPYEVVSLATAKTKAYGKISIPEDLDNMLANGEITKEEYSWSLVENKQRFISQVMTSKAVSRTCEDIDEATLSYAEIKAVATGNPLIKEKMQLENDVQRLKLLKSTYDSQRYSLEDNIVVRFPKLIKAATEKAECVREDMKTVDKGLLTEPEFAITVKGVKFKERVDGGTSMLEAISKCKNGETTHLGEFKGFELLVEKNFIGVNYLVLRGKTDHKAELSSSPVGNMVKLENLLGGMAEELDFLTKKIEQYERDLEQSKVEYEKPFAQEAELSEKIARLNELNVQLDLENGRAEDVDLAGQEKEEQSRVAEDSPYHTRPPGKEGR